MVYVLPVERLNSPKFGDGLLEVKQADLHNQYQAIFVTPTFWHIPWYGDHATNQAIRQESYLLDVVLPFIEKTYPARAEAEGRLLLGFSKSGWGACTLLLRHPEVFGKAAAWDTPMMMDRPAGFGSKDIFGTQENFEKYQITKLLDKQAKVLGTGRRLILMGYGNFRAQTQQAHELMTKLKIDHEYKDGPERKHIWGSGWLPEAVNLLFGQKT